MVMNREDLPEAEGATGVVAVSGAGPMASEEDHLGVVVLEDVEDSEEFLMVVSVEGSVVASEEVEVEIEVVEAEEAMIVGSEAEVVEWRGEVSEDEVEKLPVIAGEEEVVMKAGVGVEAMKAEVDVEAMKAGVDVVDMKAGEGVVDMKAVAIEEEEDMIEEGLEAEGLWIVVSEVEVVPVEGLVLNLVDSRNEGKFIWF